jgi:hypothetical protein
LAARCQCSKGPGCPGFRRCSRRLISLWKFALSPGHIVINGRCGYSA